MGSLSSLIQSGTNPEIDPSAPTLTEGNHPTID